VIIKGNAMDRVLKKNATVFANFRNITDGVELLSQIQNSCLKAVFFDPQYRGILEKMTYGNEGKSRGKSRCELPQMTEDIIIAFLEEIEMLLKPSGYLFCG